MKTINVAKSILLLCLGYSAICCHSLEDEESRSGVIALRYSFKHDVVTNFGHLDMIVMEDSTFIYYLNDRVVMKMTFHETELKTITTDSGVVLTDSGQPVRERYTYFSFVKGDSIGNYLDTGLSKIPKSLRIDSMWKKRVSFPANMITNGTDSLIDVMESSGFRTEYYATSHKPDPSYCDTTVISFSDKLKGIPFTFNEELDKSRKMKLISMQCIYSPYYDSSLNAPISRRVFSWEIRSAKTDAIALKLLRGKEY